jgi:hypothetical protein
MFVNKSGGIKTNFFAHVLNVGCSVQRENVATDDQLIVLASDAIARAISRDPKSSWYGVLLAKTEDLRKISIGSNNERTVCIYDTALKLNPAHAEISISRNLEEDDIVELRHELSKAFSSSKVVSPNLYRNGRILNGLPAALQ